MFGSSNPGNHPRQERHQSGARGICAVILSLAVLVTFTLPAAARGPVEAREHLVSAANPYASEAGLEILRRGGSAVDAAITIQLVLTLVEPQSSGIGGGAFMLYHQPAAEGQDAVLTSYDGRETAPREVTPDLFAAIPPTREGFLDAIAGGRSVGTPGVVAMLAMAHEKHGRLPWGDLFAPAIRLAEEGFTISPRLQFSAETDPLIRRFDKARAYLLREDGRARFAGTVLRNPEYAKTLRHLQKEGPRAFYEGPIADAMVAAVRESSINPGALSHEDLKEYEPLEREPVCGAYRLHRVCGMPPPSSGGTTVIALLGILERFPMREYGSDSAEAAHLFAEASRLAYADRDLYVADPDFIDVPVAGLVDPGYLKGRAALINPAKSMGVAAAGTPPGAEARAAALSREIPATSHFVVTDKWGGVVSMTTSVENAFGSRVMAAGFFLNNQLTDFSFRPERDGLPLANAVAPGKRPRSSMAPTVIFDPEDRLRFAIGSPGGPLIIDFVARAITGLIDWNMPVSAVVAMPHVINTNGVTQLESASAVATQADRLRAMGHEVNVRRITSGLHGLAIEWRDGQRIITGGADPRREGVVLGD